MLAQLLGGTDRVRLAIIGDQPHASREVAGALGVPVAATLPVDAKTAAVLSDGEGRRHSLSDRPLMRAAKNAAPSIARAPGLAMAGLALAEVRSVS